MFNIKNMNNIHLISFNKLNNNDVESFFIFIMNLFKNEKSFKLIFDLTNMKSTDIIYLPKILQFMIKQKSNTIKYIEKTAIIIKNKSIKSIMDNLVFKIHPPVKPNIITNNINKALDFLH
tara:strand:+ start:915 stop:1274 length:360 start_codon:yes stop_codon:yes gene_type:complete